MDRGLCRRSNASRTGPPGVIYRTAPISIPISNGLLLQVNDFSRHSGKLLRRHRDVYKRQLYNRCTENGAAGADDLRRAAGRKGGLTVKENRGDEQLVRRMIADDREAFDLLMESYYPRTLRKMCIRDSRIAAVLRAFRPQPL